MSWWVPSSGSDRAASQVTPLGRSTLPPSEPCRLGQGLAATLHLHQQPPHGHSRSSRARLASPMAPTISSKQEVSGSCFPLRPLRPSPTTNSVSTDWHALCGSKGYGSPFLTGGSTIPTDTQDVFFHLLQAPSPSTSLPIPIPLALHLHIRPLPNAPACPQPGSWPVYICGAVLQPQTYTCCSLQQPELLRSSPHPHDIFFLNLFPILIIFESVL